jgi:hypothetical protein
MGGYKKGRKKATRFFWEVPEKANPLDRRGTKLRAPDTATAKNENTGSGLYKGGDTETNMSTRSGDSW